MNGHEGLERQVTAWLAEVATPAVPEYTNEILQLTARQGQRPRWSFPERWIPMHVDSLERVPLPPVPWRKLSLLAAFGILTAALVAGLFVVGSPTVPQPFGLARNGLVAYAKGGDIFTVDPATGTRTTLVSGPEMDHDPRWSLDGTRLAFLREAALQGDQAGPRDQVVIVDADERGPRVIASEPLMDIDSDSVRWAPDGRSIVVVHTRAGAPGISLVDTDDGRITKVPVAQVEGLEVFWRPPDGRELLITSVEGSTSGLSIVSMDDGTVRRVPLPENSRDRLRAMGWTLDGSRILAHHLAPGSDRPQTSVIDPETGAASVLDVAFGHISNDGTRVAGLTTDPGRSEAVCVVHITGGTCDPIGRLVHAPDGTHGEGLQWSPDDEWIVVQPLIGSPYLLDPDAVDSTPQRDWVSGGAESWQRAAP